MNAARFSLPVVALLATTGLLSAAEPSRMVDCFPDDIVEWAAVEPDPDLRFGAAWLPGIVLGPPGDSLANTGSTSVASLGHGGHVTLVFEDMIIEDGPGPDFIVFENAFFVGFTPTAAEDPFLIFAESGIVEVSADGAAWLAFPHDSTALADSAGASIDGDMHLRLGGLAGITPTLSGNWTVPDDPESWDPGGAGGLSGAGGNAFDLADVGLSEARFVRITDAGSMNGFPGSADGFDLDGVVVLHGRPVPPATPDGDGDRLPDALEIALYGTDPADPDSDGDGVDDGREAASCRDPSSASTDPVSPVDPSLWLLDASCTEFRWTFLGTGIAYDLIRGELDQLDTDLGPVSCLADDQATVAWSCDADPLAVGEGWFYLVRGAGESAYGRASSLEMRLTGGGCG